MISPEEISHLLKDLESDRVERTISTTDTDKFGQAICAFANDLPAHNQPGYLILGAKDNGNLHKINITDELLKNLAAIRTDGNVQPQPSMVVEKVQLPDGEVVVVEVQPALFPPVKYKGRIWIRIGPRKGVANEADERILYEKRAAGIRTFDAMPCIGSTIDDLDVSLFKRNYLPLAIPDDVIDADKRDIRMQMQSLGFYDMRFDCPTNAGIIVFGKNPERILPGAYVQYVRFKGSSRAGEVKQEYKFSGNLCKILFQLDTFVDTSITNSRPVPVSALREETIKDYPHWATRELLMNACCHRDYESNGPVQFYQYDDRLEIQNHGGLYGLATRENFPDVNDYRNPIIAEAMKVLGFVNRYSRGVVRVEEELQANGNGQPQFSLDLVTAFRVVVPISEKAIAWDKEHPEWQKEKNNQDRNQDKDQDRNQDKDQDRNQDKDQDKDQDRNQDKDQDRNQDRNLTSRHKTIYDLLKLQPNIKYSEISDNLGIGRSTIYEIISDLKSWGYIERKGGTKHPLWVILK